VSAQVKSGQSGDLIGNPDRLVRSRVGSNPDLTMRSWSPLSGNKRLSERPVLDRKRQRRGSENHHRARYCNLDCTGSAYCRHQGRLGGHDDRNETGGWVIPSASGQHWSARGKQPTALALLHQLGPIFAIFGASDRDKSLGLESVMFAQSLVVADQVPCGAVVEARICVMFFALQDSPQGRQGPSGMVGCRKPARS